MLAAGSAACDGVDSVEARAASSTFSNSKNLIVWDFGVFEGGEVFFAETFNDFAGFVFDGDIFDDELVLEVKVAVVVAGCTCCCTCWGTTGRCWATENAQAKTPTHTDAACVSSEG